MSPISSHEEEEDVGAADADGSQLEGEEQASEISERKRRRVHVRPDTGATEEPDTGAMEPRGVGDQDGSKSMPCSKEDEGATVSEGRRTEAKQAEDICVLVHRRGF